MDLGGIVIGSSVPGQGSINLNSVETWLAVFKNKNKKHRQDIPGQQSTPAD